VKYNLHEFKRVRTLQKDREHNEMYENMFTKSDESNSIDVQTQHNTCHCPIKSNLRNFQLRKHLSYKCPIIFLQNR
jgi:hypothetical protein